MQADPPAPQAQKYETTQENTQSTTEYFNGFTTSSQTQSDLRHTPGCFLNQHRSNGQQQYHRYTNEPETTCSAVNETEQSQCTALSEHSDLNDTASIDQEHKNNELQQTIFYLQSTITRLQRELRESRIQNKAIREELAVTHERASEVERLLRDLQCRTPSTGPTLPSPPLATSILPPSNHIDSSSAPESRSSSPPLNTGTSVISPSAPIIRPEKMPSDTITKNQDSLETRQKSEIVTIIGDEDSLRPSSIMDLDEEFEERNTFKLFIGIDDKAVEKFQDMEEEISKSITSVPQSLEVLRRTRAVTILGNRLMMAENETKCFEEISKLLVALFQVERSSYTLMIDDEHFTIVTCSVAKKDFASSVAETNLRCVLKGTAIGHCAKTLQVLYTPRGKESKFTDHINLSKRGLNTFVNVPILIGERKFAGCLNVGSVKVDAFSPIDVALMEDVAATLGTHVYAKRLYASKNESHKLSQKLLFSLLPPQVIEKIEHYWSSSPSVSSSSSMTQNPHGIQSVPKTIILSQQTSLGSSKTDQTEKKMGMKRSNSKRNLGILSEVGKMDQNEFLPFVDTCDEIPQEIDFKEQDDLSTNMSLKHALYAEEASDVSIIFTDIVGFSAMSMKVDSRLIMDMLHDLFHRFDMISKKYGIFKLETIGDAYLCTAGLFEDTTEDNGKSAALRILAASKEMILAASKVTVPKPSDEKVEYIRVRLGIHVGNLVYGVLGRTIPKLVCYGNSVNMAARMEQTSLPNKIQVTQDFHDLVGDDEKGWETNQTVAVKNMGEVSTWMLDPFKEHLKC